MVLRMRSTRTTGQVPKPLLCAVLAAASAVLLLYGGSFTGLRLVEGTYRFGDKPAEELHLPLRTESVAGQEKLTVDLTAEAGRVHAGLYRVEFDDCLEEVLVNGKAMTGSALPSCNLDSGVDLPLGRHLRTGLNHIVVRIKDTGGQARFSLSVSRTDPLRLAVTAGILLLLTAGFLCLVRGSRFFRATRDAWTFWMGGTLLRIAYVLSTSYMQRAHDAEAHVDYIKYIADHFAIPPASGGWEFHQPPLYYFIAGGYMRLARLLGKTDLGALLDLQWLSLALSAVALGAALWAGHMLFAKKERSLFIVYAAIVSVFPGFVFLSSRLSNDALFIALCFSLFAFLVRWWKEGRTADWLIICTLAGLGFITKANILPLLPVVGICLLLKPAMSRERKTVLVAQGAVIFLLLTGWQVSARLSEPDASRVLAFGNQGMNGVLMLENTPATYLTFNPLRMVTQPFNNPWNDSAGRQFFWEFYVRSGLFGEFGFPDNLRGLSIVLLIFGMAQLPLFAVGLWRSLRRWRPHLPWLLTFLFLLCATIAYRFLHPCACNQDYRFVPLLIVPLAYFIARGTAGQHMPVLRILPLCFAAVSGIFLLALYVI